MTVLDDPRTGPQPAPGTVRSSRARRYVMCRPTAFAVRYAINPWMDTSVAVDRARALAQWEALVRTYRSHGHTVELIEPLADHPDMVFAANGAVVAGDRAYGSRFRYTEREAEAPAHATWLTAHDFAVQPAGHPSEGEGDFLVLAHAVLAGSGFRTDLAAHVEAAAVLDRPVVSLELVDPRFYHLDTALAVLDDGHGEAPPDIAYFPGAFSRHSRRTLRELFPDALLCSEAEALSFGLNAVGDGRHVFLPADATELAGRLAARGYAPVPVDLDEFLKAGGSVKCCTMELHR
ncbi:Amidinotransferase [Aeromicrobium marinum DSM 15272]|uniref:Amidinotransferase n=1 Tax=Aeromicrobium marinum DSM 15272 TaxID=585531 RepID=E2SG67_9ACTN|nr:dimethylargininase [Aeromicrobium marinum]EFQ81824.1 Amidinotransferase [Aeromicrobium marinum DSM 15272]